MSSSAFERISPAYPQHAPWGTASSLRAWQAAALEQYRRDEPRDFLAVATPGAGKTTFALRIAKELLERRVVRRVMVVAPTEHLKVQWAEAAAKVAIHLDPGLGGSSRRGRSREFDGIVATYAAVGLRPFAFRPRVDTEKTLVIFDEIHHAGDSRSWGDGIREAFETATRRLALTGTPFRSDDYPIPFVAYDVDPDGARRSRPDFSYGYAEALRDHVVRPVLFMNYGGEMRWRTKAGEVLEASLGQPLAKDVAAHAWRAALDPAGEWIPAVLTAADRRLSEVRRHIPDAGGLVIASDQASARAYARMLGEIAGEAPTVVLSDAPGSSAAIEEFAASEARWMVAVRMVSEGVDVPRLAVGVYATSTSTPLFFAQAVGRFVRARRRGEVATVFLPTVATILSHAATLERERDHVIVPKAVDGLDDEALAEANRTESAADDLLGEWVALGSQASFDHVMFESHQFGMHAEPLSHEEHEWLGLPGLLESDQISHLLADRQRRQVARRDRQERKDKVPAEVSLHKALATQRKQLNSLVAQYARSSGRPHSHVHAELRRQAGGPSLAKASTDQVGARIALVREWLARR